MASVTNLILGGLKTAAANAVKNATSNNQQSASAPASSVANAQSASVPESRVQNSVASAPSSYTPMGTHNDATVKQLSAMDTERIAGLSNQWHAATAAGNSAEAAEAHRQAEAIRAAYNYSGGADGSDYIGIMGAGANRSPAVGGWQMQSPTLPQPNSYEQAIRDMNEAYQQQQLAGLRNAYDNSVVNLDRAEAQIAPTYQNARNQTAAVNAQNTRAMNEAFAARGLNTGASGQAALAQNSVLQRDMTTLNESEAEAISEIQLQRRTLENEYQFAIENAKATGNYQLAQNLLSEWQRYDGALMSTAMNQFGVDLQAANFNYGIYNDDRNFNANRADAAFSQNLAQQQFGFQQSQANQAQQNLEAEIMAGMGNFSGYESMGITPSDQWLAAYNQSLLPRTSGGGGGGGSSGSIAPKLTYAQAKSLIESGMVTTSAAEIYSAATGIPLPYIYEMYGEPIDAAYGAEQGGAVPGTPVQNNSGGFLSGIGNAISGAGNAASNVIAELGFRQELAGMSTNEARAERVAQAVNSGLITTEQGYKILASYVG